MNTPLKILGIAGSLRKSPAAVLRFLNIYRLNLPEVMITNSAQRLDQQGKLVDEPTRDIMRKFLHALVLWTRDVEQGEQIQA